jgi:endonuclease/exonuclease/phosphatase family protein
MAAIVALVVLAFLYRWPGDSTLEGEILTIWPPELWAGAFIVLAVIVALADRRYGAAIFIATFVFIIVTAEWASLFRRRLADPASNADSGGTLRLVTWNVARSPDLRALEPLHPDLCLFQESAPVVGNPTTSAYWEAFHWASTLDPAVFSRYPFDPIEMGPVGPWGPPQAIVLHLPSGARVLVVNVRLVLPGIVMQVASPSDAIDLRAHHRDRVAQFERLSKAVSAARLTLGGIPAIACGDFNTPGYAVSVRGLSPLADVWPRAGRGWGGTMGDDLPIARIDQCWASEDVQPLQAWVERGRGSDYRFLVVDLAVR